MRVNKFLFVFLFFVLFISIVSPSESSGISLSKGKNTVSFNMSEFFYVKTLVKLNPEIEVVSFVENNKTVGYINFIGGIGDNFVVRDNVDYEIIMKDNATIILPY